MPYAQAASSLVGEILDSRYKIIKKLGEGGMGEVYAAEHIHIDKRFAIKLLRPEIVSNQEAVTRFQQEARSSSSIKHRNIIAIDDFGKLADGRIYMCMELLDGAALNDLIMQPQSVERLLNILIQTGHGLAAAHSRNIVHRDMKPENIFVTFQNGEDIPKILDFGIAKVSGNDGQNNLTRTGTIFGTPFYMAPEQALGNPVDARTDIYAMGVIMYEVFAGSLPFQGESFMGILTQHITSEPEPVAQRAAKANRPLPPGLAEIITRCMQKNPAQRFNTMDELVNLLISIYRTVAGAGMSTYMEAFPGSAQHPVQTPGPMTAAHMASQGRGAHSATVGVGAPPGSMPSGPSGGHPYATPASGSAQVIGSASSSSGLYDPSASNIAPKKKSSAGLIIAILAVLAVGGGVAAFVVMSQKDDKAGGDPGSGSQVASGDGSGSGSATTPDTGSAGSATVVASGSGSGSSTTTNNGSAGSAVVVTNGGGSGSQTTAGTGSGSDAGSASPPPIDAGTNVATNGSGSDATVAPDAGVVAPKTTAVSLVAMNLNSYEVYLDGKVLPMSGLEHVVEVPEGEKVKVTIKAKGFKDKELTVDGKLRALKFSLTKIPSVVIPNSGSNTPPPPKCTGTPKDLMKSAPAGCGAKFCKEHPDNPNCDV